VNEQALDTKRSYANAGMCCATEENREQYILALTSLRPVTLRYPARFVSLCCAGIQSVNTQCKADCGVTAEVLVKILECGVLCSYVVTGVLGELGASVFRVWEDLLGVCGIDQTV